MPDVIAAVPAEDALVVVVLVACNLALVFAAKLALTGPADFELGAACFFALLITLIIWLYDVYKPVHEVRFR